ncbi:lysophospholipase L1-like esterase [Clostridium acetobutylicum]|uniref:Probable tesA-like protease n=1 Tax=Clostridium acetobutylicum (strain ATCC 824 / DSM 792 / JCM 1419 / IAM 19013 / LMG 5710 / NBRC 13948 / NRRL B-527 / VKM B-1787 / 2291 / W) TaxID=272562 RepID=Q97DM5_CLOAB|nr:MULTISPECIES: SGNH/GDSL hydrolase family protein [Clostridium]AAK81378.1 Probable tesA-like protease [Clostridium acetobutylicum ATCC 824]ADZ22489.1 putative tesA-like protease [Clostridium acetobutylicum EA 2018]AEI32852.1 tesA-like protease [Clostridium acetobutylicum DSM 1731]AWV80956.1 peptidase [Clostridium acetobutylicum]MBC2393722.1 peptidase [Clostridium acetobutylicum]
MKLVCIGDSLTYGYGVSSTSSWVELLKAHFSINVINKGINGDTTSGILSRSYSDIVKEKPNYVIIMAGTNDMLMDYSTKLIKDNIELLLKEAKENNITPILALQPPVISPLAKTYWDSEIDYEKVAISLLDYIRWAKAYCINNNIAFVSFNIVFINKDNIEALYNDGIHPNSEGHKLMFNELSKILNKII